MTVAEIDANRPRPRPVSHAIFLVGGASTPFDQEAGFRPRLV
jgi:hypothetical protein